MRYIIQLKDTENEFLMGGKARSLAQLRRAGFLIPDGFVISPEAFTVSITSAQYQTLVDTLHSTSLQAEIQPLLLNLQPSKAVKLQLMQALAALCPNGELVAVRSSASDEDGLQYSFAGQLDSFLGVSIEQVADRVVDVWRSSFSDRLLAYRRENNLPLIPHPPSVLIQRMVNATVSGVAFAADPVTGKRSVAVVSAVYGLGSALVSGEIDADTYVVDRKGEIIQRQIADKQHLHTVQKVDSAIAVSKADATHDIENQIAQNTIQNQPRLSEITTNAVAPDLAKKPALTDQEILAIVTLVLQVSKYLNRPQDIEWAISEGQLYLLQSRPITTLNQMPDPEGIFNLWDNSNIAESYNGITTPLTFSFARRAYEEVYRQFCRFMGVPVATINRHSDTFSRMIGLIRGRVYYNLLSWYRVLALLPGFRINRRFMEQMMGVRESLPESIVAQLQAATWHDRLQDSWRLLKTVGGLITNYFFLQRRIRNFYRRLNTALNLPDLNLEDLRADELAAYYRQIESQLLTRWDAPLINDFFAMIFYGLLRNLTQKWCASATESLQNDLISGEGKIISAEPAKKMRKMAALAIDNPKLVKLLCQGSLEAILAHMEQVPALKLEYQKYLDKFGDRCLEELKLESPTLHDDPLPLLRTIGNLSASKNQQSFYLTPSLRYPAERQVKKALKRNLFKRLVFKWVLNNARKRVRDRENLRFERTRVFGRARRIFVELGKRFYALDLLDSPRDIFYLEVGEILGMIEGTTTCTDLKGLVAVRQAEFAKYKEMPPPSDRFATLGIVCQGNTFQQQKDNSLEIENTESNSSTQNVLQGIGCSPGIIQGTVRVITNPKQVTDLQPGCILVAERTDPGWILLFSLASGLLVERGSLLSHAAIVSRELGIPAIVSLPNVTQWLKDGDLVELDGSTGRVWKIDNNKPI